MKIEKIELFEIGLPLVEPFATSSWSQTDRRIMLLKITNSYGLTSWSECVAGEFPAYLPETIDTAWSIIVDFITIIVQNTEISDPREISTLLDKSIRGWNMAKGAVEMGIWNLFAKTEGKSLSEYIGGTRTEVQTGISIGLQESPDALATKAASSLAEGYKKIKIKIKPGKDIEYAVAVRDKIGMDAPLMVDANNAYTLSDIDLLKELDQLNLIMIEQPLAWNDHIRHATLQKKLKTPICLDESITSLAHAEDMIALDSGRIINIKPGRVGGFANSIAIHDLCQENNIPVWCGGMLESGVGRAYNVALASLPNFTIPGDISPSRRYWTEDVVSPEWDMDGDGNVTVPTGPGLGIEVDEGRIEKLAVRKSG